MKPNWIAIFCQFDRTPRGCCPLCHQLPASHRDRQKSEPSVSFKHLLVFTSWVQILLGLLTGWMAGSKTLSVTPSLLLSDFDIININQNKPTYWCFPVNKNTEKLYFKQNKEIRQHTTHSCGELRFIFQQLNTTLEWKFPIFGESNLYVSPSHSCEH